MPPSLHMVDDCDRRLGDVGRVVETNEARDASPLGVRGILGRRLRADREVVPPVGVEQTAQELLGKPGRHGEEPAVARLGRKPVEGRQELPPVRRTQQPESDLGASARRWVAQ